MKDGGDDQAIASDSEQDEKPQHSHHKHAFANPAEMAKKWNDPDRDKWQQPEEIVAALDLKLGATVADIGSGTGYMVAHLSKAVDQKGTVIAIDASSEMIEYLSRRSDELSPAKVVPQKVGDDDPELKIASVDRVLTLDTWHHIKDQANYATRVYEGLKRGGRFVVVEYEINSEIGPPKQMRLQPEQVMKQLDVAVFRAEIVPETMPRHFMIVGHKD